MATTAAIEVVIRARDEASAAVTSTMRKITATTKETEKALTTLGGGRAKASARELTEFGTQLAQGQSSTAALIESLGSLAAFLPGWGKAIGLLSIPLASWVRSTDDATKSQTQMNRALQGFEAGPFVAELKQAQANLDALANSSAWGRIIQHWKEALGSKSPEQQVKEALGPAIDRLTLAGEAGARQARVAREQVLQQSLEGQARAAERVGNLSGVEQANREIEASLERQLVAERELLNAERRRAEQRDLGEVGRVLPTTTQEFTDKTAALEERAIQRRESRREDAARAAAQREEQATQKRLENALRVIDAEKAVDVAVAQMSARRATAEAERRGTVEQITQAQLRSVLAVHDAEMRSIAERANARARAARGPTREEDVLGIRREEQQARTQAALAAAAEVQQVTERALQQRQQREEQFRAIQRSLGEITTQQELARQQQIMAGAERFSQVWLDAYQQVIALQKQAADEANAALDKLAARAKEQGQPTLRASDAFGAGVEEEIARHKADVARKVYEAGGSITPEEAALMKQYPAAGGGAAGGAGRYNFAPWDPNRPGFYGGAGAGGGPNALTITKNAAGELTIADDFSKAAESATKLTTAVQGLAAALKELQVGPDLISKISEGLADALTFMGARHP